MARFAAEDGSPALIIIDTVLPQRSTVIPIASGVGMRASSTLVTGICGIGAPITGLSPVIGNISYTST